MLILVSVVNLNSVVRLVARISKTNFLARIVVKITVARKSHSQSLKIISLRRSSAVAADANPGNKGNKKWIKMSMISPMNLNIDRY
jgi:hypothetical protein